MGWADRLVWGAFALAVIAALAVVGVVITRSTEAGGAPPAGPSLSRDESQVVAVISDYARAVQRDDPEAACATLAGQALERFDCRFGRARIPAELRLEDGRVAVDAPLVQGDQALAELKVAGSADPVRLQRTGRVWRIVRVGIPTPPA